VPVKQRRDLIVSKGWPQACLLVVLFGFLVLGILAYKTYQDDPPVAARVVDPVGRTLFTSEAVSRGQKVFLHNGLMEYGSIFGHGAYLSVVLLGLASVIALAGILLTPSLPDLILLGAMLAVSALVGLRMSRAFAAMPSGFPDAA
jgi:hypothetical protein